jgi:HEAT repeat protein
MSALDPGSPLYPLDVQLRTGSHVARIAAAEKLAEAGEQGALVLMLALRESDAQTYETAAWGIEIPLIEQDRGRLGKEKLRELMRPATQYLTDIVWSAAILKGASAYDRRVSYAIGVLGSIGDRAALPALEGLLTKVRRKIEVEGVVREYVETREKLGWVSTDDDLHHLERQIENINAGL